MAAIYGWQGGIGVAVGSSVQRPAIRQNSPTHVESC